MEEVIGSAKSKFSNEEKICWIAGLLGALSFILIFGINVLRVTNVDWLLSGGDLTQHYLGWVFYRESDWQFPIGCTDTLCYPNQSSIIFTDSIPLFAVLFKLISPFLPDTFQYFGLFGILCFILQGYLSAKIITKYNKNVGVVLLGAVLMILSPIYINRMFIHTALAAQWLILWGIYLCVYRKEKFSRVKSAAVWWAVLGLTAASIHIYFLPMCGVLVLVFTVLDFLEKKKVKSFVPVISYLISAAFTIFVLGGFTSDAVASASAVGEYSFNLNGFLNPQGWSSILEDLPYFPMQYEGFAYLGLGVIGLFIVSCGAIIYHKVKYGSDTIDEEKKYKKREYIVWGISIAIFGLLALSPTVTLNLHDFTYPLPDFVLKLWGVFRATGRFVWPLVFMIGLFSICVDCKVTKPKVKAIILTIACMFQIWDLHMPLYGRGETIKNFTCERELSGEVWQTIASDEKFEHIILSPTQSINSLFLMGKYASDNDMTLNRFYFARSFENVIGPEYIKALENIKENNVYVFSKNDIFSCIRYDLHFYSADGYIIGVKEPLAGVGEADEKEINTWKDIFDGNNIFLKVENGEDVNGIRQLNPQGVSYGPYITLTEGKYKVSIEGNGLEDAGINCRYGSSQNLVDVQNLNVKDNIVTYEITLDISVGDAEFVIVNEGTDIITIKSITVEREEM